MFDQIKAMGALAGLMKNKDKIQDAIKAFQGSLEVMRAVGTSGSGAVRATVTGKMKVVEITLDPTLVSGMGRDIDNRRTGEQLIVEALNDALQTVQVMVRDEANRQTKSLGLPELPGLEGLLR